MFADEEVDIPLPDLSGWQRADGALRRSIKFPSFLAGIDAVRRVADRAEKGPSSGHRYPLADSCFCIGDALHAAVSPRTI